MDYGILPKISGAFMKIVDLGTRSLLKTSLKKKYIAYRIQLPPQAVEILGNDRVYIYIVDEVVVLAPNKEKFTHFLLSCVGYNGKIPGLPDEVHEYIKKYKRNKKGAKWIQKNVKRLFNIDIPIEYIRALKLEDDR